MIVLDLKDNLLEQIKILTETIWAPLKKPQIDAWLENFENQNEKIHALFLLTQFNYFGYTQLRELIKAVYRDLFKHRIITDLRKKNKDTKDFEFLQKKYDDYLKLTRFLGLGNPSESGIHLLYYLRQENKLSKKNFIHTHEIFSRNNGEIVPSSTNKDTIHFVFLDDFSISGDQAIKYSREGNIDSIRKQYPNAQIDYLTLISTKKAKDELRRINEFDFIESVFELDDSFKCFSSKSRYFSKKPSEIDQTFAEKMSAKHGKKLMRSICRKNGHPLNDLENCAKANSLGFSNGQLLISLPHNTPDNTLPIFWYNEDDVPWNPVFKRHNKVYGD